METFLLKRKNRITENKGHYSIHHCYDKDTYKIPATGYFKNLISIVDCEIKPNMGILPHLHGNKKVITVLIDGILVQKNSLGETYNLKPGDVQINNEGKNISHFEYNKSKDTTLNCIQFSLTPNINYSSAKSEVITLKPEKVGFQKIIESKIDPDKSSKDLKEVYFYYGFLKSNTQKKYLLKSNKNGILILNISGTISVNGELLENRDMLVIRHIQELNILSIKETKFFLIEI
jgi:redox-sensitive bicupin YhaK (pirin superfamily)